MKTIIIAFVFCLFFTTACNEQLQSEKVTDLTEHNMKIVPDIPESNNEIKLVIYDDCIYNTLSGMKITGNTIDVEKQFNSMMKWPCIMRNDTISFGKLPEGTFTVHYKLMDIASPSTPKIALSVTFNLVVSR